MYLHKKVTEINERNKIKTLGSNAPAELLALSAELDFFNSYNHSNYFKSKMKNKYLEIEDFKKTDFETPEFFLAEKEKLKKNIIPGDVLILFSKTQLGTNVTCDFRNTSIIYFSSDNSGVNFGFLVNKFLIDFLIEQNGGGN